MKELLFEIGTEELPAGYIEPALQFLADTSRKKLAELGLHHGEIKTVGTPRRMALNIADLQDRQPDRRQEYIGPAKKAGFDEQGEPTRAAIGFAGSRGITVDKLQTVETDKGEYLMVVEDVPGKETSELLPGFLEALIDEVPFPKSMRWADSSMSFARPIQWLLALYGGTILPMQVENIASGCVTYGHRFMSPQSFPVGGFTEYMVGLEQNAVIADGRQRREMVIKEVMEAVKRRTGGTEAKPLLDEGLVDTVTNLVEIPWGVCGSFDEKFLALPEEVLITSMREHQKYFPVIDQAGTLMPLFVAVNNTRVEDRDLAANGHERVLRARLEDALFFFNEDKKKTLADRLANLTGIIFQKKLGTMAEKSNRIADLSAILADHVAPEMKENALRAARLAKADLLCEMVGEFPSLQGIMGREYALLDGEENEVAVAIHEHYKPVRAGGELPNTLLGALVGIADRMDTLIGCFAIGEKPTGNKDAFGLRRQAIGLINIIRGQQLSLSLRTLAENALQAYAGKIKEVPSDTVEQVLAFIKLRFANEVIASGVRQEVVEAALSVDFDDLVDCLAKISALEAIQQQTEFSFLAGSFKRIRNIIKENSATEVQEDLLTDAAENTLYTTLVQVREKITPLLKAQEYGKALAVMLEMKEPLDRFFDDVMVMADDRAIRQNRLNLLTALGECVLQVGDISKMHVG